MHEETDNVCSQLPCRGSYLVHCFFIDQLPTEVNRAFEERIPAMPHEMFAWGFTGSLSVEILTLLQAFQSRSCEIPEYYKSITFWLLRLFLAMMGGALAVAYEIDKPLLAMSIGAAAPLILQTLARSTPKPPRKES